MSLKEQQNALVRLFIDPEFRRAFSARPEETGRSHDLTSSEIQDLTSVLPTAIEEYADSLLFKRLRAVEKLLPLTSRMLNGEMPKRFSAFAASEKPDGLKKHFNDAVGFCRFLESHDPDFSTAVADVARFERKRLEFLQPERRFALAKIPPVLSDDYASLDSHIPFLRRRRATFALWLRLGRRTLQIRL